MSRNDYEDIVKHPGKFEGEAPYVPYFYDCYMDGYADEDYGNAGIIYKVDEADTILFPKLKVGDEIGLFFSDQGFVYEVEPKDIRQVYNEIQEENPNYEE